MADVTHQHSKSVAPLEEITMSTYHNYRDDIISELLLHDTVEVYVISFMIYLNSGADFFSYMYDCAVRWRTLSQL